jgi:hypothetical protein
MPYFPGPQRSHATISATEFAIRLGIALVVFLGALWYARAMVLVSLKLALTSLKAIFTPRK